MGACARWSGGTGQVNLDFYGLGLDRPSFDQKVRYSLQFAGAVAQVNWQLAPKSPWALGLRYVMPTWIRSCARSLSFPASPIASA